MISNHIQLALTTLLFMVAPLLVSSTPGNLVNSCDRNLQIGATIMTQTVKSANEADQVHSVSLVDNDGKSVCGTAVDQGQELTIQVDSTLVGARGGIGPQYIVESTNSLLQAGSNTFQIGCDNTRIVNPDESTMVAPLGGDMIVRLLYAYGFGQVYAADECTVTATATRTTVKHVGYLVDNDSWEANSESLSMQPYALTVEELLSGASSGFSVLKLDEEDGKFSVKYQIDESDTEDVSALLESLDSITNDVQISITGFESDDSSTVELLAISQCTGSDTCNGFYPVPTDQVCLAEGICIESSVVNEEENTLTTTIVTNDDSWFGIGFSTPGGGMNGGGSGADIFVCSEDGLSRFLVSVKNNPATTADELGGTIFEDDEDADIIFNFCELDTESGTGRMTFTRGLTEDGPRPITVGTPQSIIYARGPVGEKSLIMKHPSGRRGEVTLDLTDLSSGVNEAKTKAVWILWCHIILMSLSWGLLLPIAVILASRTRNIGPEGRWFALHKQLARIGWTLQTMGVIFGIYYCELYSEHFQFAHTIYGIIIAIAGFLQPISAVLRPHPPKGGWVNGKKSGLRIIFEIYHKGIGWFATISGMINVFLGAKLAMDLKFEDIVNILPMAVGGVGIFLGFLVLISSGTAKNRQD